MRKKEIVFRGDRAKATIPTTTDRNKGLMDQNPPLPKSARKRVRDNALSILDDPKSSIAERLHAMDVIVRVLGIGARLKPGRKKKDRIETSMAVGAERQQQVKVTGRSRLDDILAGK